jgi:hypothetical protein
MQSNRPGPARPRWPTLPDLALGHGTVLSARRRAARRCRQRATPVFAAASWRRAEFSSDIDLVLAFAENGQTDGTRPLANEAYFARVAQQLVKLLAEITVDGYVFRVDLRLRPFGSAGRVALSFTAMEQYYQREGRDWERYAWIKARPVAGDIAAGKRLGETLRPFVYRRYLDYTAFAGLREMKALIAAEVARKDLAQHLKLGPGGIREIEFIVQLLQLIRGGREPGLRERGLLPALAACERIGASARPAPNACARPTCCCASSREPRADAARRADARIAGRRLHACAPGGRHALSRLERAGVGADGGARRRDRGVHRADRAGAQRGASGRTQRRRIGVLAPPGRA